MHGKYHKKIAAGLLAVSCAFLLMGCRASSAEDTDSVLKINEQDVVKAEYQMVLNRYKAQVKSLYTTDDINKEDFWTTEFEEGIPLKKIMRLAEEELIRKKVVAEMAAQYGIEVKTDYVSIMEQLEQENSARQNGGSSESAVYGLTSFDADSYYQYVYTGLEAQLTEKLKQEQDVPESELKQIYEEKKAQYTYDVGVKALVAEMSAAVGEQKAAEAAAAMQNQKDEKKLAKQFPEINFYTLSMSDLDMQEGKSGAYAARWQTASQMKKGDVSAPFHIGDNLMVIRCLSRTEHGVQRFEDVKNVLKSDVQTQRAQEKIQSQIDGAMLGMNEKELEIVALEELQRK